MTNLKERHAELLAKQMIIGKRLQDLIKEQNELQVESLKIAGQIDLVEQLLKEEQNG